MLQLIIFAALAAVVLFQLYSVLGRRVGRQPEDQVQPEGAAPSLRAPDLALDELAAGGVSLSGLAAVKARDPSFELPQFLAVRMRASEAYARWVRGEVNPPEEAA